MEIGIIVHSLTGNTLSVAERLQERLTSDGHDVEIEQLKTTGEEKLSETKIENMELKGYPDPQAYDLLIIAGPVGGRGGGFHVPLLPLLLLLLPS